MNKNTAKKIYDILNREYPDATVALEHKNAMQLLVATILSAQCTDKRVNIVTKDLFKKYKQAGDFAKAKLLDFEQEIRSTGFYKNKARNIIASAKTIVGEFEGKVPETMKELITLPGVARKTANIVLFHAFSKNEGIAVDTHVKRLSGRLGLTENDDPAKIEIDLMGLYGEEKWGSLSDLLITHGRTVCDARRPRCEGCSLKRICPEAIT